MSLTLLSAVVAAVVAAAPEPCPPRFGIPRGEAPADVSPAPRPPLAPEPR